MKRIGICLLAVMLLFGCTAAEDQMDRALALRQRIIKAEQCSFDATITADYTDSVYVFKMHCVSDSQGKVDFEVISPDSIAGITGSISSTQSNLTFDGQVLAFPPLADDYITPVSAPWVMMNTLRSGYIHACGKSKDGLLISLDDSYQNEALQVDIQLDVQDMPVSVQMLWKGRKVLTLVIENFTIS